jgi:hypothetical protein
MKGSGEAIALPLAAPVLLYVDRMLPPSPLWRGLASTVDAMLANAFASFAALRIRQLLRDAGQSRVDA